MQSEVESVTVTTGAFISQHLFHLASATEKKAFNQCLTRCMLGYKNGRLENLSAVFLKMSIFEINFEKLIVLEAKRLEPRSGPTNVGPDHCPSLFAILQKYG